MDINDLIAFRRQKDRFFASHTHSPLTPEQKQRFTQLSYYPPNPLLALEITVNVFEEQEQILIQTNKNELRPFFRYGTFTVTVEESSANLTIYRSPEGHYFLPFVDANAGIETYGAGRYLDLEPLEEHIFEVDFNVAYNPYCAYNDRYVCPLTPPENRIDIPIRAGEKLPEGDWVMKA